VAVTAFGVRFAGRGFYKFDGFWLFYRGELSRPTYQSI
jgi:hypothetical protein